MTREIIIINDQGELVAQGGGDDHHGGNAPRQGWDALQHGKTLGKATSFRFNTGNLGFSPVDILSIQAEDRDAMELSILLSPIRIAPDPGVGPLPNANTFTGPWQSISQVYAMTPAQIAAAYGNNGPLLGTVRATISWGIGGAYNEATVDWVNGSSVHIHASFVRMSAQVIPDASSAQSMLYQLGAQIGPGNQKFLGAQYTEPLNDWDTGEVSGIFPVPNFARRVSLACMAPVAVPPDPPFVGSIRFWRNFTGPTLGTQQMGEFLFSANNTTPVPIPNGAYFYDIVSQTASPNKWFAVFDLAI